MNKTRSVLLGLLLPAALLWGAGRNWTSIRGAGPGRAEINLVSSSIETSVIHLELAGFFSESVRTPRGEARVIRLDHATPVLLEAAPDLPKLTASVIIPDTAEMRVDVLGASFEDYEDIDLAPSKGNLMRDIEPGDVPYSYGPVYERNGFFPGTLAELRTPHIVRDHRGQTVVVYPFQYNPVTRTLRVYYDLTVSISPTDGPGKNPLLRSGPSPGIRGPFRGIYRRLFLNSGDTDGKLIDEPGPMLIVSYGAFREALGPFVDWKKGQGFDVTLTDVADIGDSAAIKTYIAGLYRTAGLAYVLLVGDAAQVPTSSTSAGDSDNDYSYVAGDDHYPDLCVGRFSAESVEDVETQVQRSLWQEMGPPPLFRSVALGVGIASSLGPGDDDEMDYEHIRRINDLLLKDSHVFSFELFDGSQGGYDATGDPDPAAVSFAVNAGAEVINYAGHGSRGGWKTSGFDYSDIGSLLNIWTHPVIWSVACKNGDFVQDSCFAEVWLRATHDGAPTGAAAFLGSTINQSWDPPMCGQDEMNALLAEACAEGQPRRFGPLSMAGCMKMNDEYGPYGEDMTDAWTCFGDPSLVIFPFKPMPSAGGR